MPAANRMNFVALVVEDDPFQREWLADLLQSEGSKLLSVPMGRQPADKGHRENFARVAASRFCQSSKPY
jgi:CheY-like chemotaxis protein